MTNDGLNSFAWDANGRPTTADGVTLTYDALGRMVETDNAGAYTEIVYGPTGSKLALMNGQSLTKAFVPLPAGATAIYNSSGLEYYRHADWLGSARLTSTPSRTVSGDAAYAPFGETYAESGGPDASFTGQNPDTNANLYDFMYREYGIQGRWPSPDPLGPGAFSLADPQSLDLYAYVRNSPARLTDPFGLKTPIWEQLMQVSMVIQGSSIQFGSNWNEFEVLQTALTATGSYRAPNCADPTTNDCGWSTVSVYGNSGILDFINTPGGIFDGPGSLLPSGPQTQGPQTTAPQHIGTPKTNSQCSIYLQGGTTSGEMLNFICREAPNGPRSQQMRGCLQALYSPTSGYLPLPIFIEITPGSFFDLNSFIPGAGAHAVCAADAFGIQ